MDEVYSSFGVSRIFAFAEREVQVVIMRFTDKLGSGDYEASDIDRLKRQHLPPRLHLLTLPAQWLVAIVVIGYGIWDLFEMWRAFFRGEVFDYKLPNTWPYFIFLGILYVLS